MLGMASARFDVAVVLAYFCAKAAPDSDISQNPMTIPGAGRSNLSKGMTTKLGLILEKALEGHRQAVYAVSAISAEVFFTAGGEGLLVRWEKAHGAWQDGLALVRFPEPVYALHATNERVFAGTQQGNVYEWHEGKLNLIAQIPGVVFRILEDAQGLWIGGAAGCLLHLKPDGSQQRYTMGDSNIRSMVWVDEVLFCGSSDGNVYTWAEGNISGGMKLHDKAIFGLAYLPHMGMLLSGGRDAVLRLNLPGVPEIEAEIKAHLLHIHDIQLSPDNRLVASSSMDKTLKLWDATNMELLKVADQTKFGLHSSSVNAIAWLDARSLVTVSDDKRVAVWRIEA
jgi:hypothetical protein